MQKKAVRKRAAFFLVGPFYSGSFSGRCFGRLGWILVRIRKITINAAIFAMIGGAALLYGSLYLSC